MAQRQAVKKGSRGRGRGGGGRSSVAQVGQKTLFEYDMTATPRSQPSARQDGGSPLQDVPNKPTLGRNDTATATTTLKRRSVDSVSNSRHKVCACWPLLVAFPPLGYFFPSALWLLAYFQPTVWHALIPSAETTQRESQRACASCRRSQ